MNQKQAESLYDILEKLDEVKSDIRISVTDHFSHKSMEFNLIADIDEACEDFCKRLASMLETPAETKTWLEVFEPDSIR